MCCFSGPVDRVSETSIFARSQPGGRQALVYEMRFSSKDDVAMILPIPTPVGAAEDAVRFIDLQDYPDFFRALQSAFPTRALSIKEDTMAKPGAAPPAPLPVVDVGAFEASFVPSVKDFERLDARFRLPGKTWDSLPAYRAFGFAVFKLKKGDRKVHPMAFEFPRAHAGKLFFPTVHIHDGLVHAKATFDHALYGQSGEQDTVSFQGWRESPRPAGQYVNLAKSKGLVDGGRHLYHQRMQGERKNEDIVL
ncbi:MAG TPA: hypothetical protein VEJ18_11755 [Planctomycetota bacterium]|nr:hypothetical protein [Planctomycetota bacterium]